MPPRSLLQNARRRGAGSSAARQGAPAAVELPPYEAPSYPLGAEAQRELNTVLGPREARKYEQHLVKSLELLGGGMAGVNDRLRDRRQRVAKLDEIVERQRNRAGAGDEAAQAAVADVEGRRDAQKLYLEKLEADVMDTTVRSEAAVRAVIDWRAELEDERAAIQAVQVQMAEQQARAQTRQQQQAQRRKKEPRRSSQAGSSEDEGQEEEGEEEDEVDGTSDVEKGALKGASELLKTARQAKVDEYVQLGMHQRYGLNNDYISFKKMWHDAVHGDEGPPLPDASTWFDGEGKPVLTTGRRNADGASGGGGADDDDDDDVIVQREKIDLKCPLSLKDMTEPYSNRQCKHTFEKDAILAFIRSNFGMAKCPVCVKEFRASDFYLDQIMLRRINRARQAAQRAADDLSDGDEGAADGNEEESLVIGRTANVKTERMRKRRAEEGIAD